MTFPETIKKIIFVQPPLESNHKHKKIMPLGTGYIMSCIRKEFPDIELNFTDIQSSNISIEKAVRQIKEFKPDILMIHYWTPMADFAHEIIDKIREDSEKNIFIISGGVHPSIFPEETLDYSDITIQFEAEETIIDLLKALKEKSPDLKKIKGIYYRENDNIIFTGEREFISVLDSLPFPAWDLMPMENYTTPMHITGGKRVPVICSRGCPYGCSYCVSPFLWKKKIRFRTPANVLDEIETICNQMSVFNIHFWDDNLFIKPDYIEKLCSGIIKRHIKISWIGLTRAEHIIKCSNLMPLIKKSGCIGMELGIETADPVSYKSVKKSENREQIIKAAELLKTNNIYPMFTYMALNPGDTLSTYYYQAEFIDTLLEGCGWINFFHPLPVPLFLGQLCTPHPGSELFNNAHKHGIVIAEKWTDYYHHRVNFVPFSLLDDIPVKQTDRLTYRELLLCVKAIIVSIYTFIEPGDSFLKRISKISFFMEFVRNFYQNCNGKLSVKDIALKLKDKYQINDQTVWNFTCILIVTLTQTGFIQSKNNKLSLREIDISGFNNAMLLSRKLHVIELFKFILVPSGIKLFR